MKPSDVIYRLLKETGTPQTELAQALGQTQGAIANRLKREGITTRTFLEMVDALGYEITVRPKVTQDVRTEIVVSGE